MPSALTENLDLMNSASKNSLFPHLCLHSVQKGDPLLMHAVISYPGFETHTYIHIGIHNSDTHVQTPYIRNWM